MTFLKLFIEGFRNIYQLAFYKHPCENCIVKACCNYECETAAVFSVHFFSEKTLLAGRNYARIAFAVTVLGLITILCMIITIFVYI